MVSGAGSVWSGAVCAGNIAPGGCLRAPVRWYLFQQAVVAVNMKIIPTLLYPLQVAITSVDTLKSWDAQIRLAIQKKRKDTQRTSKRILLPTTRRWRIWTKINSRRSRRTEVKTGHTSPKRRESQRRRR